MFFRVYNNKNWLSQEAEELFVPYGHSFETEGGAICGSCLCFTPLKDCPVLQEIMVNKNVDTRVNVTSRLPKHANCEGCEGELYVDYIFFFDCDADWLDNLCQQDCPSHCPFRLDRKNLTMSEYEKYFSKQPKQR